MIARSRPFCEQELAPESERTLVIVPPPALAAVARRAIFREQAVAAYLSTMRESEVLRVAPPWARGLLAATGLLVAALLAGTFFVEVEQTSRGRGVLRVEGGVQTVAARATGGVLEVGARSGELVPAGALLVRVDATTTQTALLEAERQITRADEDVAAFIGRRDREQAARIGLLGQRASLLKRRVSSQNASVARLRERLATFDRLVAEGLASALDRAAVENELAVAQRTSIQLEEEISTTTLQSASIAAELATELDRRKADSVRARDRRDALVFQLAQTEVRATQPGRVEAVVVKVGDVVAVGAPIARLIPEGAPRQVVVFVPEADRAFLREGAEVHIELDQLPSGEFGSPAALVKRVASDLATPTEITEALGPSPGGTRGVEGPVYRVELELRSGEALAKVERLLRPGSLVTARFVLRKRRLASLLLEPLKRFIDA